MKTYLNNGVVLAPLLLLLCFTGIAQNSAGNNHNSVSIMLPSKDALDCLEMELLPGMKDVSVVYANQHSGLMILTSNFSGEKSLQENLGDYIVSKNEKIKFEVIEPTATYYLSSKSSR